MRDSLPMVETHKAAILAALAITVLASVDFDEALDFLFPRTTTIKFGLATTRALLRSLGFRREGRFRQSFWCNGRWLDDDYYALLASEWVRPAA